MAGMACCFSVVGLCAGGLDPRPTLEEIHAEYRTLPGNLKSTIVHSSHERRKLWRERECKRKVSELQKEIIADSRRFCIEIGRRVIRPWLVNKSRVLVV